MVPTLYGNKHAISAGHYLASSAGFAILEAGGNAIDAGVCAAITLGVVNGEQVNFAGVVPMMIRMNDGRLVTIDGVGYWPAKLDKNLFMREHGGTIPDGILRTVIPASPDAFVTALRDFGTMSFGEVAAAAIGYARDGFAVFPQLASALRIRADENRRWPGNAAIFLKDGRPHRVNERFVQADLAATIQYMVDEERAHCAEGRVAGLEAARRAFYVGDIARQIVAYHEKEGGLLTMSDLATFRTRTEAPIARRWRGLEINTCGPWCQGPMLIESLLLIERAGINGLQHNSAEYLHVVIECLKAAMTDREKHFGDPRFVDVDLDFLFSRANVDTWIGKMSADRVMSEVVSADSPQTSLQAKPTGPGHDPDTSYVCVVDRWGNAFSGTPSDECSKSPVIPGLGICPSQRGSQSRADPNHPSGVAPGKRPRMTPNPAIAVGDDGSVIPFGCPGGDAQVQAMVQVLLNVVHFGMDVQEAIDAPRVRSLHAPGSFSPNVAFPNAVMAECRISEAVLESLRDRGHEVGLEAAFTRDQAVVEMIIAEPHTGYLRAGADRRQAAYAIVS